MTNFEKWVASLTPELVAETLANPETELCNTFCPNANCCGYSSPSACYSNIFAYFAEEVAE